MLHINGFSHHYRDIISKVQLNLAKMGYIWGIPKAMFECRDLLRMSAQSMDFVQMWTH